MYKREVVFCELYIQLLFVVLVTSKIFLKPLIFLSALLAGVQYTTAATDKIICFYASWAGYRNGDGAFHPENIAADLCTHVYYAFLGVNADGTLKILDSWNEINLGGLSKVSALKESNPNLKVLLSIGGWNAGNALLTGVAASSVLRKNLIQSSIEYFEIYGYDGLDIDWEFPYSADRVNFVTLLNEMKAAFAPAGYILSVTAAADPTAGYDVPAITKIADIINLMTYDYYLPSDGYTGLLSPLYGTGTELSVNASLGRWLAGGASADKLTISVPFYGHSYSLSNPSNHGLRAAATTGIAGPYTQAPGTLGYHEICEFYPDWTIVFDHSYGEPYIYSGTNWASFDNPESIALKAKYAKDNGLAGVAIWSIDTDDFLGLCGPAHPLLQAIKNNF